MTRYVALLGSINVGGNRLRMADLVAALQRHGFANVATVVASGNVLFDHDNAPDAKLGGEIAKIVKDAFGIETFAAVRTCAELAAAIEDNPFVGDGEEKFVHTLFLEQPVDREAFKRFADNYDGPERLATGKREVFIDYAEGVGRSALDPAMRKAKPIKGRATARNIRSLRRILQKLEG